MKVFRVISFLCFASVITMQAQMQPRSIKITTTTIGISAISINTIVAKTFNFTYPVYNCKADSITKQLFVSARQRGDAAGNLYLSRGYFMGLSCTGDTINWLNESSLFNVMISGNNLLLSNDVKTVRYNKLHGYDEIRYDYKIIYAAKKFNKGLMYSNIDSDVLNGVSLSTGLSSWSCTIPRNEDWVDSQALNDSVLLVAANGLHAINMRSGLKWSFPLSTSTKTNRSLIYSSAKYNTIQKISTVIKTSREENQVTQIASNILKDDGLIYFASKEKLIAVTHSGQLAWELDLRNYPVSKMYLSKTDSSLTLVNFGLATHSNNFVTWGKPFILSIDPQSGRIMSQFDLSDIDNLADFVKTGNSLVFAAKNGILEAKPGSSSLKTVIAMNEHKYGAFVEFINGNEYYILKEGYFVPLNFINDNLIYFKADNNKIYGLDSTNLLYEYHFNELYKLNRKFEDKTILMNDDKTLITNSTFELLFTLNTTAENIILNDRIYFIEDHKIHLVLLKDLK